MQAVSLKLARRIEVSLAESIGTLVNRINTQKFEADTKEQLHHFMANDHGLTTTNVEKLLEIRFMLRHQVAAANESSGVNKLIQQIAELEAQVGTLKALSRSLSGYVTSGEESALRQRQSVEFKPNFDARITSLKFQIGSLRDRCAGINSQTTINLPDEVVVVLSNLGIPV
jgi:hypothetical protein